MKTTKCPLGGDCGGTGWLWWFGRGYPDPEPPEWYPCECNPRRRLSERAAGHDAVKNDASRWQLGPTMRRSEGRWDIRVMGGQLVFRLEA